MDTLLTVSLLLVIVIAVLTSFLLMRQAQRARLAEVSAREKLLAGESELQTLRQAAEQARTESESLQREVQTHREELARVNTSLDLERKQFGEKLELLNESRERLGTEFKNLANEIFEDKSKKFTTSSKEALDSLLNPLQEKIQQFEKRVEETYQNEARERFSLKNEIENLRNRTAQISEEAVNLANALKGDNKAQGNWGELVLESILERSGLVKGREYDVQVSMKSAAGTKSQPDVIVHLPESRDIIIDSKVSLKAWDALCASEDKDSREELLKQHVQSIRLHVKNLSGKDYQNLPGINSLDYVFLFMPIEAAYSAAAQHDPELFQFAFERNIVFVVPTTLLTTLKTVQNLWRLAQQNQNAKEIADKAGALYDKFVAFVDDLEEVGQRIDASKKSFDKAHNKLVSGRGNLIRRVEALKQLGARTSKKQRGELLDSALQPGQAALPGPAGDAEPEAEAEDKTTH